MQTIAIIGASGNMGSAISKRLAKGNYRLLLCTNEQEKVHAVVEEIKSNNPFCKLRGH
ncbi:SDR family oxidoreductase [Litoribacter populi]|uniref:SDR family oxidoreductase n=1 Tax=Litoribacter populi TaxID=2598460 RepID=UPI0021CFBCF7|nr:SDR family oxidoreductase [Litoribacter populi]